MDRRDVMSIAAPALLAVTLVWLATALGIGITTDGTIYLEAAQRLALGQGYVEAAPCAVAGTLRPIMHYPPLYPWVLSLGIRLGLPPFDAARLLQIALAGANTALVAGVVRRWTRSAGAAALAGVLFAVALGVLEIHSAAWSEPLCLLLGLAGIAGAVVALETGRLLPLCLGAAALGAAALTRYAAGGLVAAMVVGQLVLGRGPALRRLGRAALAGAIGAAPLMAFAVRNVLVNGRPTDRTADLVPLGFAHLKSLLLVAGTWLVPGAERLPQLAPFAPVVMALGFAVLAAVLLVARRSALPAQLALVVFVHVALLLVSIAAFDHFSPLDQRNLMPAFQAALVALVVGLRELPWRRGLRAGVVALLVAGHGAAAVYAARYLHRQGRGYLTPAWRYPRLMARVAELPGDAAVISNLPDAVFFLAGHRACSFKRALGQATAAILYFEEPRRFAPRVVGGVADPGPGPAEAQGLAARLGFGHEERERNAVLYTP